MLEETLIGRRKVNPLAKTPAACAGHRLAFSALGFPPFEPSFASVEPIPRDSPPAVCHGVLWRLTNEDWLRVCATEGVPLAYVPLRVRVNPYVPGGFEDDQLRNSVLGTVTEAAALAGTENESQRPGYTVSAVTLRAVQASRALFGLPLLELPPSRRYMGLLRAGAKEAGLSSSWQAKLAELPSVW